MVRIAVVLCTAIVAISGCASISAKPFSPDSDKGLWGSPRGIRFYEPTPVLIVTSEKVHVAFVPNPHRGVAVGFRTFLSKHKVELTSEDGSLTKLASDADTTAIPAGILTLLQTLGTEAIKNLDKILGAAQAAGLPMALGEETAGTIANKQGVYLFEFSENGDFVGLKSVLP